jgi:hypothetical protein
MPEGRSMSRMKTITVNGVPYSLNDKQEVYMYGTPVRVGLLDANKAILFADGWMSAAEEYRTEYRGVLKEKTGAAMEKAKKQFEGTLQ